MGKTILTFGDTDIEKNEFYHHKFPIFKKNIKTINTLLVTCIMIIKLSHYI